MSCPPKFKLKEHKIAITKGEIEKSGMANHIWRQILHSLGWSQNHKQRMPKESEEN